MYKEMLERMFPTREKRMNFMANCALTFGLRIDGLSEVMGEDKDKLYNDYVNKSVYGRPLEFLFNHGFVIQEEAMNNFVDFFTRLTNAYLNKDVELIHEVLLEISDKKALDFRAKHAKGGIISDEEILTIVEYQLKYGLPTNVVTQHFKISRSNYCQRVVALEDKYPKQVSNYYYVSDYYQNVGKRRYAN